MGLGFFGVVLGFFNGVRAFGFFVSFVIAVKGIFGVLLSVLGMLGLLQGFFKAFGGFHGCFRVFVALAVLLGSQIVALLVAQSPFCPWGFKGGTLTRDVRGNMGRGY